MENCITSHLTVGGTSYFRLLANSNFMKIIKYLNDKTNSLKRETEKKTFREGCKGLANYLIQHKNQPSYEDKIMWEKILYSWANTYYSRLDKHGGCPVIIEDKDLALLNLKYEAEDFCEEKKTRTKAITCFNNGDIDEDKCDEECAHKIKEYNAWINSRKLYFNEKENLIIRNCKNQPSHFPTNQCNILEPNIYKTFSKCKFNHLASLSPSSNEKEKMLQEVSRKTAFNLSSNNVTEEEDPKHPLQELTQTDRSTKIDQVVNQASESVPQNFPSKESSRTQSNTKEIQNILTEQNVFLETPLQNQYKGALSPDLNTPRHPDPQGLLSPHFSESPQLSPEVSVSTSVPSFSNNKSKHFTDDHLENPIYDDEEIIKKIKINELTKNVNSSKRQKDRSKTIIEIHMEVLEECRNEDWESSKEAFLKICLDEFTKKDYRTYPNLTYNDLITENIKSSNDIEKQNILWSKWVERHRYLFAKLKKEDWYNNLKNEWKKKIAYIQERDELKKKSSNENHNFPFLEIEKDLWKHWISKKGIIIEQYLEQEWIKELDMDLNIMSDECVKEDTKNYVTLINIEELQHKENYEELCKYIKKKLLTMLCILVLMSMLEEYKKEVNFDNRESFLDISINEWKTKKYSGKDSFRNEIEGWIGEDDLYASSIVNNGTVEKSIDIAEKHIS
ncbi:STP1 protein [Plasmodium malariae]|uniref:STP1 protein n=1 Tax=Plasmodium malariae TaxID=5858 RepID=A0A1A8WWA8_PLAMA|nr:STP1 protein [Plasmodium malariae]